MHEIQNIKYRRTFGILFIAWAVGVIILTFIPQLSVTSTAKILNFEFRLDYLIHLLVYSTGMILFCMWQISGKKYVSVKRILLFLLAGIAYAVASEYLQMLVPGRVFNINDMIYNVLGLFVGLICFFLFRKFFSRTLDLHNS